MSAVLVATLEHDGVKIEIFAEEKEGGVEFTINLVEGQADLNGFFIDLGNDGGGIKYVDTRSNNMNGSDADGVKLDGFDHAALLGSVGGNDADYTSGTAFFSGLTLAEVDGAQLGIRATSVGEDREDSLKLTAIAEVPQPAANHFPIFLNDIVKATFYFNTTDGDVVGVYDGDPVLSKDGEDDVPNTPDGVYTVEITKWPVDTKDFNASYDAVLQWLIENDPNVSDNTEVLGVALRTFGENKEVGSERFYAVDGDPEPDPVPDPPKDLADRVDEVDQTYSFDQIFA